MILGLKDIDLLTFEEREEFGGPIWTLTEDDLRSEQNIEYLRGALYWIPEKFLDDTAITIAKITGIYRMGGKYCIKFRKKNES